MSNENSHNKADLAEQLHHFIQKMLDEGHGAAELSFHLAEASTAIGLDLAPDAEVAIAVVMDGLRAACASRSASLQEGCPAETTEETIPPGTVLH